MPSFFPPFSVILFLCLEFLVSSALSQPLRSNLADSEIENGISSEEDDNLRLGNRQFREESDDGVYSFSGSLGAEVAANIDEAGLDSQVDGRPFWSNNSNLIQNAYHPVLSADRNNMYPLAFNSSGSGSAYYPVYGVAPGSANSNENQAAQVASGYSVVSGGKVQSHPNGVNAPSSYQLYSNAKTAYVKPQSLSMSPYDPNASPGAMVQSGNPGYKQVQSNPAMNYGPDRMYQQPVSSVGASQSAYQPFGNVSSKAMSGERGFLRPIAPDVINNVSSMSEQSLQENQAESVDRPERAPLLPKNVNPTNDRLMEVPLKSAVKLSSVEMGQRPRREMADIKRKTFIVDENSLSRSKRRPPDAGGRFLSEILGSVGKDFDAHKIGTISLGDKSSKHDADVTLLQRKSIESAIVDQKPVNQWDTKLKTDPENQKVDPDLAEDKLVAGSDAVGQKSMNRRDTHPESGSNFQKTVRDPDSAGDNIRHYSNLVADRRDTRVEIGSEMQNGNSDAVEDKLRESDNIMDRKLIDHQDVQLETGRESQKVDLNLLGDRLGADSNIVDRKSIDRRDVQIKTGYDSKKLALDSIDDKPDANDNIADRKFIEQQDIQLQDGDEGQNVDLDSVDDQKRDTQPETGSEREEQNEGMRMVSVGILNRLPRGPVSPPHLAPVPESQEAELDSGEDKPNEETEMVPIGAPNRLRRGSSPCLCTSKISVNAVVPCSSSCKTTTSKTTPSKQRAICTTRCVLNVLIPCKSNLQNKSSAQAEIPEKEDSGMDENSPKQVGNPRGGSEEAETENKEKG